jgi:hypothetical protein
MPRGLTPFTILVPQLYSCAPVSLSIHPIIVKRTWDSEREREREMMSDGQTQSSGQNGAGDERGAGGKARKPPPRKQPSTPYSRPPPSQSQAEAGGQRRWLSKLVDPAYRLISSGATRFIPSLFSKPASSNALPSSPDQDHRKLISLRHSGILFLHLILSD